MPPDDHSDKVDAALAQEAREAADAFELYFEMGPERTLEALADDTGIAVETLEDWFDLHSWESRIVERMDELQQAFSEEFHVRTMHARNRLLEGVNSVLDRMDSTAVGLPFEITSVQDFTTLAGAYERLARANVLLSQTHKRGGGKSGEGESWADLVAAAQAEE